MRKTSWNNNASDFSEEDYKEEFIKALKTTGCEILEDGNIIYTSKRVVQKIDGNIINSMDSVYLVTSEFALSKQVAALWSYVNHDSNRAASQVKKEEAHKLASAWSIVEENLLLNGNKAVL